MHQPFIMQYPSLASQKPIDVLRLIRTLNVGPITFFQLVRRFGTAGNALAALPDLSLRGGRKNPLTAYDLDAAEKEMADVEKFGARMILYGASDYPRLLHAIPDPPPIITVLGNTRLWQQKDSIAMVGARNASANGCQFAQRLAKDIGNSGLLMVSGLARGIDTFVHKGSLASGTIAVIAGGIDNIYPPENQMLYHQIKDTGCIISEQPFGAVPFSGAFPGRNRIIAGMSLGTVVVEAALKSGSLITARFALENSREVFAVPGSPLDPRSKGCNQLIKDGAHMVESAVDILNGITHLRNMSLGESVPPEYQPDKPINTFSESEVDSARSAVLEKLSAYAVAVDTLIDQCGVSAPIVLTILLEVELAGKLKRVAGNKVYLLNVGEESLGAATLAG